MLINCSYLTAICEHEQFQCLMPCKSLHNLELTNVHDEQFQHRLNHFSINSIRLFHRELLSTNLTFFLYLKLFSENQNGLFILQQNITLTVITNNFCHAQRLFTCFFFIFSLITKSHSGKLNV